MDSFFLSGDLLLFCLGSSRGSAEANAKLSGEKVVAASPARKQMVAEEEVENFMVMNENDSLDGKLDLICSN